MYNKRSKRFYITLTLSAFIIFVIFLVFFYFELQSSRYPIQNFVLTDKWGIKKIYPTSSSGLEWYSNWDNSPPRVLGNEIDPYDSWFTTVQGDGVYRISDGILSISPRMDSDSSGAERVYIRDPAFKTEWYNVEITFYGKIDKIRKSWYGEPIDSWQWSGLMAYARTNHGITGKEDLYLCDNRGYGGRILLNGMFDFEKETAHHQKNGYDTKGQTTIWYPDSMPLQQWVGYKFIVYDRKVDGINGVQLEQWIDKNNDGNWIKLSSYFDNGENFGHKDNSSCSQQVDPQLALTRGNVISASESKKPHIAIYLRTDYQDQSYKHFSIREIQPPNSG